MVGLPSGTVTFLLTDVEGGPALWDEAPASTRGALARHDLLFEDAVRTHGGHQIGGRGGAAARGAVFATAHSATMAAVALQQAGAAERWSTPRPIRVRVSLHTGEADLRDGEYVGPVVERCARLRGIGHGGQILLSEATAGLLRDDPPPGTSLRYLGEHRLGDLAQPERVYQVLHPALSDAFPPLATLDARVHNLPMPATPLLGRERELEQVRGLLLRDDVQLVTLTGAGGTGKTRLALQVGLELLEHTLDGVFFVSLAPIGDPALTIPTIAQSLGLREIGGRSLHEIVTSYLRDRTLLLVLDNFEQLLPAGPDVAALLARCGRLKILVTSRALLHIQGEHEVPVPPLDVPTVDQLTSAEVLSHSPAVSLFAQRAHDVRSDFRLTDENARSVAQICQRLDGLPLAIELAGARTRLLSPEALLQRLDRRLPVLTGGARSLPARQRTLRDTIAWSYDLLDQAEQALFRQLAVFVGGFTLDAAEAVCGPAGASDLDPSAGSGQAILDGVSSLADKSLLRQHDGPHGEPRFWMLETIREFALERLSAGDEGEIARLRHAQHYLALAEEAEPALRGPRQTDWLDRLEEEHDNVRAALTWATAGPFRSNTDAAARELGMRLTAALTWFWLIRGYVSEGYRWLNAALANGDDEGSAGTEPAVRARALAGAGHLAQYQSDHARSFALLDESIRLAREAGDQENVAWSLGAMGETARLQRDFARAATLLAESLALARQIGDRWTMYHVLYRLGEMARNQGEFDRATALYEESLAIRREFGDRRGIAAALHSLGLMARGQGQIEEAATLLAQAITLHHEVRNMFGIAICLEGLGGIALERGQSERALRLLAAVEALCEAIGAPLMPAERAEYERDRDAARGLLGEDASAAAWAQGRAMSASRAVAYALEAAGSA
jgi:predicted ATPase/class 3 adenylate cyclase